MSLAADVRAAAGTLQAVSAGLAAALRVAAGRPRAPPGVVDTFRGAEAMSLTVAAVLDEAEPLLALLVEDARVVGCAALPQASSVRRRRVGMVEQEVEVLAEDQKAEVEDEEQQFKQEEEEEDGPRQVPAATIIADTSHGVAPSTTVRDAFNRVTDCAASTEASTSPSPLSDPSTSTTLAPPQQASLHSTEAQTGRVRNGYDALGLILLSLLRKATDAVSDVASNQSVWLLSPLQAKQCFEAMSIHHAQLKAMYGIIHLTGKIIRLTDPTASLFVDVTGTSPHPDLEPVRWRAAIKMDAFYGRYFGFHYRPEMRNFLRVVNIARGSLKSAAATAPDVASPFVRNIAALGWGWVYSHMVILNNLGVSIDRASSIGSDNDRAPATIDQVRAFMNLAEDPFVSGVAALASVDISIDLVFDILPEAPSEVDHQAALRLAPIIVPNGPIAARVMSSKARPVAREVLKRSYVSPRVTTREPKIDYLPKLSSELPTMQPASGLFHSNVTTIEADAEDSCNRQVNNQRSPPPGALDALGNIVRQLQGQIQGTMTPEFNVVSPSDLERTRDDSYAAADGKIVGQDGRGSASEPITRKRTVKVGVSDVTDSSLLATAIKNEFVKFQSNVTSFLGQETVDLASNLVFYIHGGGFVSQSSGGHAVYLKEWAVDIPDSVILCIDYKLAPEFPYPTALDECLYAYQWALQHSGTLGTRAERIVLCGDSAGGNLAVALAMKANLCGMRPADGICLAYPALYVNPAWSPSRLLSFFDPLLPLSILDLCVRAYVPDGSDGSSDPFISPMVASDEDLRALPPITIISGTLDPLMDDAVQFVHKLRLSGRTCDSLQLYESLPHGFLNMIQVCTDAREAMCYLGRNIARYLQTNFRKSRTSANAAPDTSSLPSSPALLFDS